MTDDGQAVTAVRPMHAIVEPPESAHTYAAEVTVGTTGVTCRAHHPKTYPWESSQRVCVVVNIDGHPTHVQAPGSCWETR